MNILETTLPVGAKKPFRVLHFTDTHLTYADIRDGERKVKMAEWRAKEFPEAQRVLDFACATAKELQIPLLHTGDLIDYVSKANLEAVKAFTDQNDCFMAAGNHEFSLYLGEEKEDAAYRNRSLAAVQAVFRNNIRMDSRVIGGVNFVALDNGYYLFEQEQFDFLKQEVQKGLPIVLMMHTPLYDPALYERSMQDTPCAYLVGVPDEKMRCYPPERYEQQKADALTLAVMDYIKEQTLIKAILAGHLHFNAETTFADRIPQLILGCTDLRLITFV